MKAGTWPTTPTAGSDQRLAWMDAAIAEANSTEVRGLTAVYLHTLIAACPRPAHAPVYGRMVLEGAIHRTVAAYATRLHQMARADTLRGSAEDTLRYVRVLLDVLSDLARRWGTDSRPVAPPTPLPQPAAAHQPPVSEKLLADEEYLLAVLTAHPDALGDLVGWLRPEDFAEPGHGRIYRCLGALHHRGEPIDEVTVLWEAQRRGALADGTLTAEDVLRLCDSTSAAGIADYLGEQVVRASLVRTAADAARQVRALADDESLVPGRLIGYALHALSPLEDIRRRWRAATGAPEAASATPRAPQPTARVPSSRADAARARSRPHPPPSPNARSSAPPPVPYRPLVPTEPLVTPIVPTPPIPTAADTSTMSALAEEFTAARRRLDQSRLTGDGLPSLAATANQMQSLGRLINYHTDEVLFRITEPGSGTPQQRRAVGILATATTPATRAVEYLAEAHAQLGVLHQYAQGPATPILTDIRKSALDLIRDRLDEAGAALQDASEALNSEADR
ncbi:DnaB-like helicase N-terminal domain-containing protein [Streptomyces hygroscopicus]|uniref:DnaB-like helicase N-terminal domain-containing protein n=1 Tax=Streptomyces hygroscopicus TaxID=1912 RepID=UPI00278C0D5D|nr:DnaB-like helicase N-terminal domain-containing protein [Streptomyces hygroscopicus]